MEKDSSRTEKYLRAIFGNFFDRNKGFIEVRFFQEGHPPRFYDSIDGLINDLKMFPKQAHVGVCPRTNNKKGRKKDVYYVLTLWTDVDYGKEGHKKLSLYKDQQEALEVINKFPIKPSIIVDTGHGFHCYWLLDEPYEITDLKYIEGILKGLSQQIGGDTTYDVSRVMRLPGTVNMKIKDKPKPVEIIRIDDECRYSLSEFEPYHVSTNNNISSVELDGELPSINVDDLAVSDQIKKLIKSGNEEHKYPSRSETDYAVIMAMVQGLYTDLEIKAIFNNPEYKIGEKYQEKGSNGDQYLAHSIGKARVSAGIDNSRAARKSVKFVITTFLTAKKTKAALCNRAVSEILIKDLINRGKFIVTIGGEVYFFLSDKHHLMDIDGTDFEVLLNIDYGINKTENVFKFVISDISAYAYTNSERSEIHRLAYFNRDKRTLYISRFDGQLYKLDGKSVALIPNGEDGVFFHDGSDWQPYTYNESYRRGGIDSLLINAVNFTEESGALLSPAEQRLMYRIWMFLPFFQSIMPTKPILVFVGIRGSGKTSYLKWYLRTIFGSAVDVEGITKEDAFIAVVSVSPIAIFDNVDGYTQWLNDHLARLATGSNYSLRKLYTTNNKITVTPHTCVALTSRTPKFRRDDVADRLLILKVEKFIKYLPETKLAQERLNVRDELMSEFIDEMNAIIKNVNWDINDISETMSRMADFEWFGRSVAEAWGETQMFEGAIHKMQQEKDRFVLETDPLFLVLRRWLQNSENHDKELNINRLYSELKVTASCFGIEWSYRGERGLAQRLSNIRFNLEEFFDVKSRIGHANVTFYRFTPKYELDDADCEQEEF